LRACIGWNPVSCGAALLVPELDRAAGLAGMARSRLDSSRRLAARECSAAVAQEPAREAHR
jgi:hypothetical protein